MNALRQNPSFLNYSFMFIFYSTIYNTDHECEPSSNFILILNEKLLFDEANDWFLHYSFYCYFYLFIFIFTFYIVLYLNNFAMFSLHGSYEANFI